MERLAVLSGHLVPQLQGVQPLVRQPLGNCLHADYCCTVLEVVQYSERTQAMAWLLLCTSQPIAQMCGKQFRTATRPC